MVLVGRAEVYSPLKQQTNFSCLQKQEGIETSHPQDVYDRPEALRSLLGLLPGFIAETLHKELHNIHLDNVADAIVLKMYALTKYEVPTAG